MTQHFTEKAEAAKAEKRGSKIIKKSDEKKGSKILGKRDGTKKEGKKDKNT